MSKNVFIVTVTLTLDLMTKKRTGLFPFHKFVKIQYTELKLSWGKDPAARHTQSHNSAPSQDGRIKTYNPPGIGSLTILKEFLL